MKNTLLVIVVLLVGACATSPTKLVKELTLEEKVVGTYEEKSSEFSFKFVFLENGVGEGYMNPKKNLLLLSGN